MTTYNGKPYTKQKPTTQPRYERDACENVGSDPYWHEYGACGYDHDGRSVCPDEIETRDWNGLRLR